MDVKSSQAYLYPRLLPVHDLDNADDCDTIPVALRTSVEKLREHGAYILENGILMFLYVGLQVSTDTHFTSSPCSILSSRIDILLYVGDDLILIFDHLFRNRSTPHGVKECSVCRVRRKSTSKEVYND